MAVWIKSSTETQEVTPANGKNFTLEELQHYVGATSKPSTSQVAGLCGSTRKVSLKTSLTTQPPSQPHRIVPCKLFGICHHQAKTT